MSSFDNFLDVRNSYPVRELSFDVCVCGGGGGQFFLYLFSPAFLGVFCSLGGGLFGWGGWGGGGPPVPVRRFL